MGLKAVRGFGDILPPETDRWKLIEDRAREVFGRFGFAELRIPILEKTEVFARSIGEETDIVEKEMYSFPDRGGDSLTLRPEGTASIVRSYIEHKLYATETVTKVYFIGPMFRYERPQKGRYRQFHQIDLELFGTSNPMSDAEVISVLMHYFTVLNITDCELHINSLGCADCRRPYKDALLRFLRAHESGFCADCQRRMDRNPLRVLDCKVEDCQRILTEAPLLDAYLCSECAEHFSQVRKYLHTLGVTGIVNPRMVRGLDYYSRTTFEVLGQGLGAQNAIAAGGRYDNLVESMGGPPVPGIGFAIGMERVLLLLQDPVSPPRPSLFIAALGQNARKEAFTLYYRLNEAGIVTVMEYEERSLKAQMRRADKFKAPYVLIVGDEELRKGTAIFRDMEEKSQEELPLATLFQELNRRLSGAAEPTDS